MEKIPTFMTDGPGMSMKTFTGTVERIYSDSILVRSDEDSEFFEEAPLVRLFWTNPPLTLPAKGLHILVQYQGSPDHKVEPPVMGMMNFSNADAPVFEEIECAYCGTRFASRFCPQCGAPYPKKEEPQDPELADKPWWIRQGYVGEYREALRAADVGLGNPMTSMGGFGMGMASGFGMGMAGFGMGMATMASTGLVLPGGTPPKASLIIREDGSLELTVTYVNGKIEVLTAQLKPEEEETRHRLVFSHPGGEGFGSGTARQMNASGSLAPMSSDGKMHDTLSISSNNMPHPISYNGFGYLLDRV